MANWSNPTLTSLYTDFMNQLKDRDVDLALQFDGVTTSNLATGTIRWNSSANRWQKWSGSAWGELTSTYALTGLSTTGNASIGGTLSVTGTTSLAAATATTPATADNSTAIATTAWVKAQGYGGVTSGTSSNTPNTLVQRDASGNFAAGTLTLTSFSVSGSPSISGTLTLAGALINGNVANAATGFFGLPAGSSAQRPANPSAGLVRFNTSLTQYEGYTGSTWQTLGINYASASEVNGITAIASNSAGSDILLMPDKGGITSGMFIVGPGIVPGTTVLSTGVVGGIQMSQASVATGAGFDSLSVGFYVADKVLSPGNASGRLARAWVNFNGTGTVAIRSSFNVSSITDNGTGQYTVNFAAAMPDTGYCVVAAGDTAAGGSSPRTVGVNATGTGGVAPTTTAVKICSGADGASYADLARVNIAVFR